MNYLLWISIDENYIVLHSKHKTRNSVELVASVLQGNTIIQQTLTMPNIKVGQKATKKQIFNY